MFLIIILISHIVSLPIRGRPWKPNFWSFRRPQKAHALANIPTPILLFPGFGASRLMQGEKIVYPPRLHEYVLNFKGWKHTIIENTNLSTLPFGDSIALDLPIEPLFQTINYYKHLIDIPNVYPIPYDFRIIDKHAYLHSFHNRVREYIEQFEVPVVLLCHSTGGLVAHWFLHNQPIEWRKKHIISVFHINVPFGGVVTALENCIKKHTRINRYIGRTIFQSFGATVLNLPNVASLNDSILFVNGNSTDDYLAYLNLDSLNERRSNASDILESYTHSVDGVETHVVYSTTKSNITLYRIHCNESKSVSFVPYLKPTTLCEMIDGEFGEGDGLVPLASLLVPKVWETQPTFHHIQNYEHSSVLKYVFDILNLQNL